VNHKHPLFWFDLFYNLKRGGHKGLFIGLLKRVLCFYLFLGLSGRPVKAVARSPGKTYRYEKTVEKALPKVLSD
jgi:hypothetical protein